MRKSLIPAVNLRWSMQNGKDRKRVLKHISDCLGKRAGGMQKGAVASLWRSGTAGRIFQTFDEQCVAVDDVRPTVSDGQHSKCTPHPLTHPHHPVLSVFYTTERKKRKKKREREKKKREKRDLKCTALHLSVFQCEHCLSKRRSAR